MSRTPRIVVPLVAAALALCAGAGIGPAAAAPLQPGQVVNEVPALDGPQVRDGRVQALAQVGDVVVVGGTFTKISDAGGSAITRTSVAAYDRTTNKVSRTFKPVLNGQVWSAVPGPTATTVYLAGDFTTIDGVAANRLALLDVRTGAPVPGFRSPGFSSTVRALALTGGRLLVGGVFTKAAGQPRGGIASVDPLTGRLTPFAVATYTENHNFGQVNGADRSPVGVVQLAASPDGSTLVTIGNFRKVDGILHDQIALLDLRGTTASVRHDWSTPYFRDPCFPGVADSWVRDVDWSPDGTFFVVGSTGGSNREACDAVVRFEGNSSGTNVQPTWLASTGGDSIYTTAVTDDAVYVGGHFRWFNNVTATDVKGPGAVPRAGIAALDPRTGLPLPWNPGRHPRDKGVFAMLANGSELLVGTDTEWVGFRQYRTFRLTRFPLAGGRAIPRAQTAALPGRLNKLDSAGSTVTAYGLTTGGVSSSGTSVGIGSLGSVRGVTTVGSDVVVALSDGSLHRRSWNGSAVGPDSVLNPYSDPDWDTLLTGVRDGETYQGVDSGLASELRTANGMFYANGQLYYATPGCFFFCSATLKARAFEPGSGASHPVSRTVGSISSSLRNLTYADGNIYYATTDGSLYRASFDGTTIGAATRIGGPGVNGVNYLGSALFVAP